MHIYEVRPRKDHRGVDLIRIGTVAAAYYGLLVLLSVAVVVGVVKLIDHGTT
jgi:hypothetical protein